LQRPHAPCYTLDAIIFAIFSKPASLRLKKSLLLLFAHTSLHHRRNFSMVASATPYRPLLQINFGSPTAASDEPLGKLAQVLVQAAAWQISQIVVERGLLLKKRLYVPVDLVTEARVDGLRLSRTVDELVEQSQAPKGSDLLVLREQLPIFSGEAKIGALSQVFFDAATRQLTHLVVHRHALAGG
jgi:hypothetical protein